jgi:hypothetical protein
MRTELAPLIVVKQEFPDFRIDGHSSENGEENNNNFVNIKSENDCNNNQREDLNPSVLSVKKSKKNSFHFHSANKKIMLVDGVTNKIFYPMHPI